MVNVVFALLMCLSPISDSEEWVELTSVSVTYYHPKYDEACRLGHTASGMRCVYDADVIALGPEQLKLVRDYYGDRQDVGAFPLLPCWECEPVYWGYYVRLCTDTCCRILRVADTGSAELQADLPRGTWQTFGFPLSQGRFDARLEVLR